MAKWYLMYDGSSPDGRGGAKYFGRTTDREIAEEFYLSNKKNPYWTGYVDIVTYDKITRMSIRDKT